MINAHMLVLIIRGFFSTTIYIEKYMSVFISNIPVAAAAIIRIKNNLQTEKKYIV